MFANSVGVFPIKADSYLPLLEYGPASAAYLHFEQDAADKTATITR